MKNKKMNIRYPFCLVIIAVFLLMFTGQMAYAKDESETALDIPIEQSFEIKNGSLTKEQQTCSYSFIAVTKDAPMPNGSENGTYMFYMEGSTKSVIGPITYGKAGIYQYEIRLITDKQDNYTYEFEVYTVTVNIADTPNGGLTGSVVIQGEEGYKTDAVRYSHMYTTPGVSSEDKAQPENSLKQMVMTGDTPAVFAMIIGMILSLIIIVITEKRRST